MIMQFPNSVELRQFLASRHYTRLPATLTGDTLALGWSSKKGGKGHIPFVTFRFSFSIGLAVPHDRRTGECPETQQGHGLNPKGIGITP